MSQTLRLYRGGLGKISLSLPEVMLPSAFASGNDLATGDCERTKRIEEKGQKEGKGREKGRDDLTAQ
jgi:hypothetical protein